MSTANTNNINSDELRDSMLAAIAAEHKTTVLCYGDSNTYGFEPATGTRYPRSMRWTTLLQEKLGSDYEVIAEGLNGRTTAYHRVGTDYQNGLESLPAIFGSHKPVDIVVFMLGTNDCNYDMKLEPADIARGMESLIECLEDRAPARQGFVPEILVISPVHIRPEIEGTPFMTDIDQTSVEKSHKLAPLYKELTERHGCRFLDAAEVSVSAIDCEHLTAEGHLQLAELVYGELCK